MRALIIDDERLARKELTKLLEEHPSIEIVGEAMNADEAEQMINELNPDLLFLDIQMPGRTGFQLLESLESAPLVVFTTAYDEFALKAFEINALDYLLKPIQAERLSEAIHKIMEKERAKIGRGAGKKLGLEDQVFVKDGERCWFVSLANIRYFESDGNYIKVYFDTNRPMIHKSLNALDDRLDERAFFRASRKHIINLSWVEGIEPWFNGGLMVKLRGGDKVEVSRRQAAKFKDMMSL
ncbi:MAG TPA: LytTR family DNA-binding domain-containing protein [Cyclobacteriaceae bacterium]|jgi:two-component system LytT family response regulator|nr:response regulator transcription factor [Cytophagales bacterium]HMR55974.1 LytTR family DNA-binding domain-containing protein [Cyclobacteriaceae bacterium]HNT49833.1 LytTR family DNA-binding domain-containing protein [Cyclobacteriaceae bacterium]HRE68003.1 LytTR family DNA-binding domain-containing protein [Cyclobacteriaceae bacterium]HRF32501.1 LytTR family DNA-binding domain-containing protein [Cyclobacteriaceae bacterium]